MRNDTSVSLEDLAEASFDHLATVFPVCCLSDEFYFFPQVLPRNRDWKVWDDFSTDQISSVAATLQDYERILSSLDHTLLSIDEQVDAGLLHQVMTTLREQLTVIAPHRSQPTFHLTVLASGLAEALMSSEPHAWEECVSEVPRFLQRAAQCLDSVPEMFNTLGKRMLSDLQEWVRALEKIGHQPFFLWEALGEFQNILQSLPVVPSLLLPQDMFEHLLMNHIGADMKTVAIEELLEQELQAMGVLLDKEARRLAPGRHWTQAEEVIPFVPADGGQLLSLYRRELKSMEAFCRDQGMVPVSRTLNAPVDVLSVPSYLSTIRASDAYASLPGYPARGGIFYVMDRARPQLSEPGRTLEYRMTAAHETWPGHHLLDICRWNLSRPLRRAIESPLFYEGWACLAEELMLRGGYFDNPWDRFLLARRRAERAARGLIDLRLQTGRMTIAQAENLLIQVGYDAEVAATVVPKYMLRPGYQVCYTLGLSQALTLLERFGGNDMGRFSRSLLNQGEIGFARLEKVLASR